MDNFCEGIIVTDSLDSYTPAITGNFIGTSGAFDCEKHACMVNVVLSKEFRARIFAISLQFSGTLHSLGGVRIDLVEDVESDLTTGVLNPGDSMKVQGKKIRCLNAEGSSTECVLFVNRETEIEYPVGKLTVNNLDNQIFNVSFDFLGGSIHFVWKPFSRQAG